MRVLSLPVVVIALIGLGCADRSVAQPGCRDAVATQVAAEDIDDPTTDVVAVDDASAVGSMAYTEDDEDAAWDSGTEDDEDDASAFDDSADDQDDDDGDVVGAIDDEIDDRDGDRDRSELDVRATGTPAV